MQEWKAAMQRLKHHHVDEMVGGIVQAVVTFIAVFALLGLVFATLLYGSN